MIISWDFFVLHRVLKQKLLSEIAIELNTTTDEISAKFHALRTQFNREMSKEKVTKSGSGTEDRYVSKWEFKTSLQFLKINTFTGSTVSNLVRSKFAMNSLLETNFHFLFRIIFQTIRQLHLNHLNHYHQNHREIQHRNNHHQNNHHQNNHHQNNHHQNNQQRVKAKDLALERKTRDGARTMKMIISSKKQYR